MKNEISIEELKKLTIGEIQLLEKSQKGVHDIIQSMKERVKSIDEQAKTGKFAEDLMNEI